MAVRPIPEGYHTVTPYLVVEGASRLIEFMREAFGAVERSRFGDGDRITHGEVQIGDSIIMLSDGQPAQPQFPAMIHLYVDDCDAVYRRALAAGATSLREPADQFYGDRSAGVSDAFGNQWWIATHAEDVSDEEMHRRMAAASTGA